MNTAIVLLIIILILTVYNSLKTHFLISKTKKMAKELDELTTEVSETKTVIDSAIVLIKGIKAKLDEAGTDATKLKALSDDLGSKTDELASAVSENTPQE